MKKETTAVTAGRDPARQKGAVNTPVYHASTIVFRDVAELEQASPDKREPLYYGRRGTPTIYALEDALLELEGGDGCVISPSGLAACGLALLSQLSAGDHLLMTDSVYGPTRRIADRLLGRLGIETTYYDPLAGAAIAGLMTERTKAVFVESPGSLSFEVQDIPAIAEAAHQGGATVILDNTWATPLHFKPFEKGVDVSIQAATKYIVGHADAQLGTVTATGEACSRLKTTHGELGQCAGPDDIFLGLRGLRSLPVRLARHEETGYTLARWLQQRPEVDRVLHPGLPEDPGHALWKRDFTGACGLFGVVLNEVPKPAVDAFLNALELFGLGYSWGGFESLVLPCDPRPARSATEWRAAGPLVRFHAGLDIPDDLIADLERGFAALAAA